MFKRFFSLQRLLDVLFDDSWCLLGLPEEPACGEWLGAEL